MTRNLRGRRQAKRNNEYGGPEKPGEGHHLTHKVTVHASCGTGDAGDLGENLLDFKGNSTENIEGKITQHHKMVENGKWNERPSDFDDHSFLGETLQQKLWTTEVSGELPKPMSKNWY